jgi:drug/metabolite transporter (DMT)-like permease
MYSLQTSLILLGMIVMGTARSVGVKALYQMGVFQQPLWITVLYLVGQSLSLLLYICCCCEQRCNQNKNNTKMEYVAVQLQEDGLPLSTTLASSIVNNNVVKEDVTVATATMDESLEVEEEEQQQQQETEEQHDRTMRRSSSSEDSSTMTPLELEMDWKDLPTNALMNETTNNSHYTDTDTSISPRPSLQRQGSQTGLTADSHQAVAWVHSIPWQYQPVIPGLFNLLNALAKWAAFQYQAASIVEMLMAGLELVLSTIVARFVRKRQISVHRWTGVIIVALGLLVVEVASRSSSSNNNIGTTTTTNNNHTNNEQEANEEEMEVDSIQQSSQHRDYVVGSLLILAQCVTAVMQDMAEELFLQESNFPPMLLLGMEGLVGLLVGLPIYVLWTLVATSNHLPNLQFLQQQQSPPSSLFQIVYLIALTFIFTATGVFNIWTTSVTSSMTRNMWKNCRTLLVWMVGLILYHAAGNHDLGEAWTMPHSFMVLMGFVVMLGGIYVYYKHRS